MPSQVSSNQRVEVETRYFRGRAADGSPAKLYDQYHGLTQEAAKEDGAGRLHYDLGYAAFWLFVRDIAKAIGTNHTALAIANECLIKERGDKPATAPEFAQSASERLAEAIQSKAKDVLELWEGKGRIVLVTNYALENGVRGAAVARMFGFNFLGLDDDPASIGYGPTHLRGLGTTDAEERLDREFSALLGDIGEHGKGLAKAIETYLDERIEARQELLAYMPDELYKARPEEVASATYDLWENPGHTPRWASTLALALWLDVVRPQLEREHNKPASLVRPVFNYVAHFHSRGSTFDKTSNNLTFEGRRLASVITDASIDLTIIEKGLGLLGTVLSHRLLRWQVQTGHSRLLAGEPYANVLDVEGGWSGLARQLGFKEKDVPDLKKLVYAQAHFRFNFPDGSEGNLLSYNERPATGQDRARLTITLGSPLLPSYVHSLPKRSDRKLIPFPREAPPLFGRPNEHGQQMTMALLVVAELRERATELATEGAVRLTTDDWTKLADRSCLPRRLVVPVREAWISGDTRSVPFLKTEKAEHYTLADAHLAERDFLIESGKIELQGAKAGARSVAKKRKKLARLGK